MIENESVVKIDKFYLYPFCSILNIPGAMLSALLTPCLHLNPPKLCFARIMESKRASKLQVVKLADFKVERLLLIFWAK